MLKQLLIERGRTYAMTMYPGYVDMPFNSPVTITHLDASAADSCKLELRFIAHAYASGAQEMTYSLTVLSREADHLVAAVEGSGRTIVFYLLNRAWCREIFPHADEREMQPLLEKAWC